MKNELEKDFAPYEESLELKELGFDEPCLKFYVAGKLILGLDAENGDTNSKLNGYGPLYVSAPTFSQAFRWFREKYGDLLRYDWGEVPHFLMIQIEMTKGKTYEEAELECLKKLIEIVKSKS